MRMFELIKKYNESKWFCSWDTWGSEMSGGLFQIWGYLALHCFKSNVEILPHYTSLYYEENNTSVMFSDTKFTNSTCNSAKLCLL